MNLIIKYSPGDTSLDQLSTMIADALGGRKASSIAFATHDYGENKFYLTSTQTVDLGSTLSDIDQQTFWNGIADNLADNGRIDLLACNLASGDKGELLVASLEAVAGVDFAASIDATGNYSAGGDWILETDNVDIEKIYFDHDKINDYPGLMWSQSQKLTASDAYSGQHFGSSVSISGNIAMVGAYQDDVANGAVYVFENNGINWSQKQKISGPLDGGCFGISVCIDGDKAVIGAPAYNVSASVPSMAYGYERNADTGMWSKVADLPGLMTMDHFGDSVSIDGDIVVVGAPSYKYGLGAISIFTDWGNRQNFAYSAVGYAGAFGQSVSVHGTTIMIGAPDAGSLYSYKGEVYIFDKIGSSWSQTQKLTAADAVNNDHFGFSVSMSDGICMVGAYGCDNNTGAAYVFSKSGSTWSQTQKLLASDGMEGDALGGYISIDGNTAVISACWKDDYTGAAYVFTKNGNNWSESQILTASDGASNDYFGNNAIYGNAIMIGSNNSKSATGAAYTFTNSI